MCFYTAYTEASGVPRSPTLRVHTAPAAILNTKKTHNPTA